MQCKHKERKGPQVAHTAVQVVGALPRLPPFCRPQTAPLSSPQPAACLAQLSRPTARMLAIMLRTRLLGTSAAEVLHLGSLAALEPQGPLQA